MIARMAGIIGEPEETSGASLITRKRHDESTTL
jgi:hypothetical protein